MTVVGCLAIDWTKKIKLLDDFGRLEVENFPDRALQLFFVYLAGAKCIDAHANRWGMPSGIAKLNFTAAAQTGGANILAPPASHVGGAAIPFRWFFPEKRPPAMTSYTAIGIADNFAPG